MTKKTQNETTANSKWPILRKFAFWGQKMGNITLIRADLAAHFGNIKMPPDSAALNAKKAPIKVIILQTKVIFILRKMRIFALFALDFPHLGFHFWAQKWPNIRGLAKFSLGQN